MASAPALPAEIWLTIFELVIETRITLVEQSDHISSPDIYAHLRSPKDHPLADDAHRQLRLVCRNFHAILGTSPHFLMKSTESTIPAATRALYITSECRSEAFKHLLAAAPSKFLRISRLDIHLDFDVQSGPTIFDVLCENSGALPNVGCLTLRIAYIRRLYPKISLWDRPNGAFPLLVSLTLTLDGRVPLHLDTSTATFQNLEVLDLGHIYLSSGIPPTMRLSSLRHVALHEFSVFDTEILSRLPLLKSVVSRNVTDDAWIDLLSLPNLRMIGIPMWAVGSIDPIDGFHPLEHVWIYGNFFTKPRDIGRAVCQITARLPGVSRITIDLSLIDRADGVEPQRMLENTDLQSSGLLLQANSGYGSRIVLERTWTHDPPRFFA